MKCVANYHTLERGVVCRMLIINLRAYAEDGASTYPTPNDPLAPILCSDGKLLLLHRTSKIITFPLYSRIQRTEYERNLFTINFDKHFRSLLAPRFCVTDRKDQRKEWIIMEETFFLSSFESQMIYRWRCKQSR